MIIENHALWGEEPTEDYPATFTYLGAEPLPDKPNGRRPAVIICGGGGFTQDRKSTRLNSSHCG